MRWSVGQVPGDIYTNLIRKDPPGALFAVKYVLNSKIIPKKITVTEDFPMGHDYSNMGCWSEE